MISKSKIDQIGERLKKGEVLEEDELKGLLEWRNSFSSTLDYYHSKLKAQISPNDINTLSRRLKRINSIQVKLKRFKTMRLSTLQDIAGVRVVLKDEIALQKSFAKLRGLSNKHKLKKLNDYHNNAKPDGYRGIHLIYQNESSAMIEIQLRTELQHIWATALEIYGELQNISFKTGEGDQSWKDFFELLSSYFAIKENCSPVESHLKLSEKQISSRLRKLIRKLNVIEQLNASTNNIQVITNKFNETGRMGKYAIIELDLKQKITRVDFFNKKDVGKAIDIYTRKELEIRDNNLYNIVFVNIDNVEKIQKSYPNYFLNTNKLLEILSKIILEEF
jgi:ppGpp synthetase/RelA/SpoT-type nucleotidyltranferase